MKNNILFLATALLLLGSCANHYVVTDNVGHQLDGTRTILAGDTLALGNTPYGLWPRTRLDKIHVVDFRNSHDTMRYSYCQTLPCDGWSITHDSLPRMLQPQVTVEKHFRWFTTRYRYTAVFHAIDNLPVPISKYLTKDEQQLLFQPLDPPSDWNGTDLYFLLNELNTKYVEWWGHCLFEKDYEALHSHLSDSTQCATLAKYHDTLLALVLEDLPDNQETLTAKARLFPELDFLSKVKEGDDLKIELDIEDYFHLNYYLQTRALWHVELPGGHSSSHMVSIDRLIMGDYVIEEHSDLINWWACLLTLLLLLGALYLLHRHTLRLRAPLPL